MSLITQSHVQDRMIKLDVGSKFEREFVERVIELNNKYESLGARIVEVYGTHTSFRNIISDVREGFRNKGPNFVEFKKSVRMLRDSDIDVNYVMNSPVLGENYLAENRIKIIDTVKLLQRIGINVITTPIIELIELIKREVNIKIYLSTVADVKECAELNQMKDIGIDRVIPSFFANRKIDFLKYAKEIDQPLELLLQSTCMLNCIRRKNHAVSESLMENKPAKLKDYHVKSCAKIFDKQFPQGFLQSPWIMPEDLKQYELLCGDIVFKVNGRTLTIDEKLFITECYLRQKSPINFGNLFAATSYDSSREGNIHRKIFIPSDALQQTIHYNGQQYDGFTDFFFRENPDYVDYVEYCRHVSEIIKAETCLGIKTGFNAEKSIKYYKSLVEVE